MTMCRRYSDGLQMNYYLIKLVRLMRRARQRLHLYYNYGPFTGRYLYTFSSIQRWLDGVERGRYDISEREGSVIADF